MKIKASDLDNFDKDFDTDNIENMKYYYEGAVLTANRGSKFSSDAKKIVKLLEDNFADEIKKD